MKKKTKVILIVLGVIVACNVLSKLFEGDSKPKSDKFVKVENVKIKGHLGDCFEVVDKEYKVQGDYSTKLIIEIKRTEGENLLLNEQIDNLTGDSNESGKCYIDFLIEFLDENHNIVGTTKSSSYDSKQIVSLVKNTRVGENGVLVFYFSENGDPAYIRLGSICEVKPLPTLEEGLKDVVDEISSMAKDKDVEDEMKDAEKTLDAGLQVLDATTKALKLLNEIEKEQ